ncbi:MAG TPA: dihydroneopterin aldolase [Hansschlegelia sp.]
MSDRIFLRGVQVHAHHGVFAEERKLGQRFVFDVDYWVDAGAYAASDDPARAVSYADVHETVVAVATGKPVALIEALAENVAAALLSRFPTIERVRIELHKPGAPIAGIFSDVGVEIIRRRGEA